MLLQNRYNTGYTFAFLADSLNGILDTVTSLLLFSTEDLIKLNIFVAAQMIIDLEKTSCGNCCHKHTQKQFTVILIKPIAWTIRVKESWLLHILHDAANWRWRYSLRVYIWQRTKLTCSAGSARHYRYILVNLRHWGVARLRYKNHVQSNSAPSELFLRTYWFPYKIRNLHISESYCVAVTAVWCTW